MSIFKKLFSRKPKAMPPMDMSVLKADVHSHLIPGIDDGAQTMDDSVALIRGLNELGYSKIITTPHVMSDYYRNTPEIILGGLEKVKEAVKAEGLDVELEAAAEYYLDHEFAQMIGKEKLLTFGDNYVLFELAFLSEPQQLNEVIFNLQTNGYKPVLAHVERYTFWHPTYDKYQELFDKGVIMQLNLNSLTGHYSPQTAKVSERLIDDGLISLLGSDTHHMNHVELLNHAVTHPHLHKLVESGLLLNSQL